LCDDWKIDYTSYDWKKLDADAEETKTMVNNYFRWIGDDKDGRKFNQGKIFK
jgi:elongation factor 1-gamma